MHTPPQSSWTRCHSHHYAGIPPLPSNPIHTSVPMIQAPQHSPVMHVAHLGCTLCRSAANNRKSFRASFSLFILYEGSKDHDF